MVNMETGSRLVVPAPSSPLPALPSIISLNNCFRNSKSDLGDKLSRTMKKNSISFADNTINGGIFCPSEHCVSLLSLVHGKVSQFSQKRFRFTLLRIPKVIQILLVISILFTQNLAQAFTKSANYQWKSNVEVKALQGTVKGNLMVYNLDNINYQVAEFLSIPYAYPPVQKNRFRRPIKLDAFPGNQVQDATTLGPACFQNLDVSFQNETLYSDKERAASGMWNVLSMHENCLSLNVWTPHPFEKTVKRPVMLWIYGGGYYSGGSALDVYQGHRLAAIEDVVVVTFNYRVGLFGFMVLPDESMAGNQGLFDQRMVIEWVHDNIEYFGGDPNQVTLFGESAGAASIGIHLLSPGSNRLFSKAILQSGSPTAPWAILTKDEMQKRSQEVLDVFVPVCANTPFADPIDCMQFFPPTEIANAEALLYNYYTERYLPFTVGPMIDGDIILDEPEKMIEDGLMPNYPLLMGSNKNEGSFWLIYYILDVFNDFKGSNPVSVEQYDYAMESAFGRYPELITNAIKFFYRNWTDYENPIYNRIAIDDATGEQNFMCPVNYLAEHAYPEHDVYMYYLQRRANAEQWPDWMGVIHGADCEWVFGKFLDHPMATSEEKQLNRDILKYWGNFARTGNPDPLKNKWPKWTGSSQKALVLDVGSKTQLTIGPRADRCAFWNKYIPSLEAISQQYQDDATSKSSFLEPTSFFSLISLLVLVSELFVLQNLAS